MTDKKDASSQGEGDSIRVMIRVRPPVPVAHEDTCLQVDNTRNAVKMLCKPDPKVFTFDQIADNDATQDQIFNTVGKRVIESCIAGYNGTIFAYGQTGSGKTYTMLGPSEDSDNFQHQMRGVIPRSFEYLFNLIQREAELHGENFQFLCKCSFLEIYNEQIYDLLDTASNGLQLREDIKRGVFVDGLIEQTVGDAGEAYEVLSSGWMNRTVASTSMNRESSRSHAVFTVTIETKENKNGVWNIRQSCLNLVDLAGSERQKDTQTTGVRLKEAGKINKSLSVLGNVIMALVDIAHGKSRHVPYRDSKLSFLLRDSLGGNAKTQMIACIHSGSRSFGETMSTLMFARRAKMIKNKAVVNEDSQGNLIHLQAEIRRLKETLSQYQQGMIPVQPSEDGDTTSQDSDATDTKWKGCFIQAMYFRGKEETKLQSLQTEIKSLKDLCNAKDKVIQNNKMILKFRDSALQRMESAHKEKVKLSPDDKDKIIEAHQQERKLWQENYNNHPEAKSYKIAYERILKEIKQLKSEESCQSIDKRRRNELISLFEELSQADDNTNSPLATQTPKTHHEPGLTERQKADMAKLGTERDKLQEQVEQISEKLQKAEAELKAAKASKEKAESLLEAHHLRSQVDRENAEERHRDTIKSLTPKRGRVQWQLRNRPVVVARTPGSGPVTPVSKFSLDDSVHESEDELITDQAAPAEYSEERVHGLVEELEKISEELLKTRSEMDGRDKQILQLVEEKSLLESSKEQLEKALSEEKEKISEKSNDLEARMASMEKLVAASKEELRYAQEAKSELEIMAKHSEKRIKEVTQERDGYGKVSSKCSALETENLKLGTELSNLKKKQETMVEEITQQQEQLETAQTTLAFMEDQLQEKDNHLDSNRSEINELNSKLESLRRDLQQSEEKKADLTAQLHQAGDKEHQIAEALQKVDECDKEIAQRDLVIKELNDQKNTLIQSSDAMKREIESIQKADGEKKEYIKCLTEKVTSLKSKLQETENLMSEKTKIIEDLQNQRDLLNNSVEALEEKRQKELANRNSNIDELNEKLKEMEKFLSTITLQLDDANEEKESHFVELQNAQQMSHELMEANDELLVQVRSYEQRVQALSDTIKSTEDMITELKTAQMKEKDGELATLMEENQTLSSKIKEKETRCEKLAQAFDSVSALQKRSADENWELKARASYLEQQCHELEVKYGDLQAMTDSSELKENEMHEHICELQARLSLAEEETSRADEAKVKMESEWKAAKDELALVQDQIDGLALSVTESEEQVSRLKLEMTKKQERNYELESSVELLEQAKNELEKANQEYEKKIHHLEDSAAVLAGHSNPKQKIHYVQNLIAESNEIKEKLKKVENERNKLKETLRVLKYGSTGHTPLKGLKTDHANFTPKAGRSGTRLADDIKTPRKKSVEDETVTQKDPCSTPLTKDSANAKENLEPVS